MSLPETDRAIKTGDRIADRFRIEGVAGVGGMATVYRAIDTLDGGTVAVKVLGAQSEYETELFARESRILAALDHPGIVRYVAHGTTPPGTPFLAMEWLAGESLGERLRRSGLTVGESVALVRLLADALAVAHARGVVHRDLKPSNLYLQDGALERVKILDFGIARGAQGFDLGATGSSTRTGMILGTPGYMAPEQARGDRVVGPSADVFSLGCVLFECLTGRPPFTGDRPMAVLAKILLEEAPRVGDLKRDVPPALELLVARMLAKDPALRPADARAVGEALARIDVGETEPAPVNAAPLALTAGEQRLLSVILAARRSDEDPEPADAQLARLQQAIAPYGGRLDRLASGAWVWSLAGQGVASDQAAQAARCALALRELLPATPIALATGRGIVSDQGSVGDVIDRAARTLWTGDDPTRRSRRLPIRVDAVTAGLLATLFEIGGDGAALELRGAREVSEPPRTLLGREMPCLGRERELASLIALFDECEAESSPRAVLITAPAGAGKSRLRHELLRRLAQRGAAMQVLIGRGDPMRVGSPFGLLAPAIRRALGVLDGEPALLREQKLRARVAQRFSGEHARRVAAFLGELCGVPLGDDDNPQLRAARRDPVLMGDQMRQAWEDFLAAECRVQPVVLVLEDLQWGDLPTVKFLDSALRNLGELPFFLLVLARPDVHEIFPRLWEGRGVEEINLRALSRKAAQGLVREVLGPETSDGVVAQLVTQSEGNPFYLEELVRSVAEGGGSALPETVLAMVQARIERLPPEGRRVLRAASVFGQAFWRSGVIALLGRVTRTSEISDWLEQLCARELISSRGEHRFPGEDEFIFCSTLTREAAYATLTDEDRQLGHRLAADWLEASGEDDAAVLAEHRERGGQQDRAVSWYRAAAEDALEGDDLTVVLRRVERGIACGAAAEELGALKLLEAEVVAWRGARGDARRLALEAMPLVAKGGQLWYAAAAVAISSSARTGDFAQAVQIAETLPPLDPQRDVLPAQAITQARAVSDLLQIGHGELAERLLHPLASLRQERSDLDAGVAAWIENALAWRALFSGDTGESLKFDEAAARSFERAGDVRNASRQWAGAAYERMLLGRYAEAETVLREVLSAAQRMGLDSLAVNAKHNLGLALARLGRFDEAVQFEEEALAGYVAQGDSKMIGASQHYLAGIFWERGDLTRAETVALSSVDALTAFPPLLPRGLATLAGIQLGQGRVADASENADRSMALLLEQGEIEDGEPLIRLVHAETLIARGKGDQARTALVQARVRIRELAGKISDPALCQSFLERVPENARTLTLAETWAGRADSPV